MRKKRSGPLDKNYISVPIHQEFYFNKNLNLPTVIKEYSEIEKIFDELQYLACITIQIRQLSKIESRYGSLTYVTLLKKISKMLTNIKRKEFRGKDIFTLDLVDVDTFIIFMSPPRNVKTNLLYHLDSITNRLSLGIEKELFTIFYPYIKEYALPSIGYALVINNPMINNMRLILQLVGNAKEMGKFLSTRRRYQSKYTLQKIIIEQNITTVFQPIVHLKTLDVLGYEALSRGPEDTEFSSPLLLFIFAAECGLSFELDRLCRKKAFERVRHLKTNKKIFVNTLSMSIHDPEFRGAYLKELLEDLKIKPENVVFEVSEKLAIDNYEIFRSAMQDYADIGIVQASDDVGKGYSDLERVMELNPGYMKIDISFVRDVDKSYIKQQIIKAMVNLANGINSEVIAEGIETKEEFEKLKDLGVHYGQGYILARPSEKLNPIRNKIFRS